MVRYSPFGPLTSGGADSDDLDSTIIVKSASQLTGTLDSTKAYIIDGVVDMGASSITVPPGGLTLIGMDFRISGLTSSEDNFTLFVTGGGSYSGDLICQKLYVQVGGTNSKVFDLDNQGNNNAVELVDFNFFFCTSCGHLTSYRQLLTNNLAWLGCNDGLTCAGTWAGGMALLTSIVIAAGQTFSGTVLKAGTALNVLGSVRSDINALQLSSVGTLCDFAPSHIAVDGQFLMQGVRVNPASNAFPNMPASDVKANFKDCTGTENTYVGASTTVTTETATTFAGSGVYTPMLGTMTMSDAAWFSLVNGSEEQYDSDVLSSLVVEGALSFSGTNNHELSLKVYKYTAATTSWAAISPAFNVTLNAQGRAENVSFGAYLDMVDGDRIGIYIANMTATADITALLGGQIRIRER